MRIHIIQNRLETTAITNIQPDILKTLQTAKITTIYTPIAASHRRGPSALPPPRLIPRPVCPGLTKAEGTSGLAEAAEFFRFFADA